MCARMMGLQSTSSAASALRFSSTLRYSGYRHCRKINSFSIPGLSYWICFEKLILGFKSRKGLLSDFAAFLNEIVSASTRKKRHKPFDILRQMTDSLSSSDKPEHPVLSLFFANIAATAAMVFARNEPEAGHLEWAQNLQCQLVNLMENLHVVPPTPSLARFGPGYKWDDCIEEWIAKTPVGAMARDFSRVEKQLGNYEVRTLTQPGSVIGVLPRTAYFAHDTPGRRGQIIPSSSPTGSPHDDFLGKTGLTLKRKGEAGDVEREWDGDFAYKRPKKNGKSLENVGDIQDDDVPVAVKRIPFKDLHHNASDCTEPKGEWPTMFKNVMSIPDFESEDELTMME